MEGQFKGEIWTVETLSGKEEGNDGRVVPWEGQLGKGSAPREG